MEGLLFDNSLETWLSALTGSVAVGFVGALPLFCVPNEENQKEKPYLELFLSVAVGSQLSDVFLHLLPEAFAHRQSSLSIGLWTLFGLLLFYFLEQIFTDTDHTNEGSDPKKFKMAGYVNLLANFVDNLSHGIAIGGSFCVSRLVGVTTLIGILIHEIPHEMGDFAILLHSGFDRRQATKAQLVTGLGTILGASFALLYSNSVHSTLWVLPFTSGAFLYVALVKTLPQLLEHNDLRHSARQCLGFVIGILLVYLLVHFLG